MKEEDKILSIAASILTYADENDLSVKETIGLVMEKLNVTRDKAKEIIEEISKT